MVVSNSNLTHFFPLLPPLLDVRNVSIFTILSSVLSFLVQIVHFHLPYEADLFIRRRFSAQQVHSAFVPV